MSLQVCELLREHAQRRPRHAALLGAGLQLDYAALYQRVLGLAGGLRAAGLRPGERAVVMLPMSAELYLVLLALFAGGCSAVFVDPFLPSAQREAALRAADARAFFGTSKAQLLRLVSPTLRALPLKVSAGPRLPGTLSVAQLAGAAPLAALAPVGPDTPALLSFTSGTTGQPKQVTRSHGLLLAQHRTLARALESSPEDVDLPALPVFLLNTLACGGSAVLPPDATARPGQQDPAALLQAIRRHGVTTLAGFPAFYEPLVAALVRRGESLGGVRAAFLGGAAVPLRLLRALAERMPDGEPVLIYGSTEAEPIARLGGGEALRDTVATTADGGGLCVGRPCAGVSLRLDPLPGAAGAGEILVAGEHVNAAATGAAPAWLRTGDCGRLDDEGRLWLLGRRAELLERATGPLFPFAVEGAAEAVPGVLQAALLSHTAETGPPLCQLFAQAEPGHDPVALARRVERRLQELGLAVDRVRFLARIPKDPRHRAKTDRAALLRHARRG